MRLRSFTRITLGLSLLTALASHLPAADSQDERQRATTVLEQAVRTDPNNAELWLHLGFAYRKLNQLDPAQAAFEKAAALNPKSSDALFMLGLIYESKHQNASAQAAWKKYLAIETDAGKRSMAENHLHQVSQ